MKIGRDILGGTASSAGAILAFDTLASLTVGGSLVGGTAIRTGYVGSVGDMGAVKIGGNVVGGNMDDNDPTLDRTGFIEADRIASVTIGGSMIAGINTNLFAELTNNASIRVADDLGPVVVKGSLIGRKTVNSYTPVIISARGQESLAPGATSDIAIRSLNVGGRVEWSLVLAGFDQNDPITAGTNGNAVDRRRDRRRRLARQQYQRRHSGSEQQRLRQSHRPGDPRRHAHLAHRQHHHRGHRRR